MIIGTILLATLGTMACALPAQPERVDHRRGRGQGRHRLHLAHRRDHARRQRGADHLLDRLGLLRAPRPRWRFGRDLRGAIFDRVLTFSARELNHFGAPSLITRNTNDVQQVQMLVVMSAHGAAVAAPITMVGGIIMALREDVGLSWLVAVAVPRAGRLDLAGDQEAAAAVPADAGPDRRGEPGPARADHRHPGGPGLRARTVRDRAVRARPAPT